MDPFETLSNEHSLIRQYLDNLTLAADDIQNGGQPPGVFFEKAVVFARMFADEFHHFKEEHLLFVRLAQKRRGELDARLGVLRQQHERGRELVTGIATAIEGYTAGDPGATGALVERLGAFTSLLRHHLHMEDHVVYPIARRELDAADLRELDTEYLKIQAKYGGDTFERAQSLVVDMGSILADM